MALGDPSQSSFLDDWYAAMMQQPAPLQVTAPEYGSTVPVGPGMPAPAPPPPPPQQLGPVGMPAPVDEVAPAETALQPAAVQPEPTPTPSVPVDQYGYELATPPMPEMPSNSIINPEAWQPDVGEDPVGSIRTGVEPGEVGMSLDERQRLKDTSPLAYEKFKIDEAEDQAAQARAGMANIARRDAEDAELSLRNFRESQQRSQEMMKQVEIDVAALANEKPKKYEAGALDLIAGVLGMLGASATGGKNVGLEMVNARIDRHIQAQRDEYARKAGNVDRKMNLIAKLRDVGYDDYQAGEVIRLSVLERSKQMLMTDIQNFDPQGTTARNKMAQYEQFNAEMAKRAEAMRVAKFDEDIKRGEYFIKARKADDEHNAAQNKLRGSGPGAPKPDDVVQPVEYFKARYPGAPVPPSAMSEKGYQSWLKTSKSGAETAQALGQETPEGKREREFGINGPDGKPLLSDDDKPVQGRDIGEANELTLQIADTDEVIRMMDEVLRLRQKHGWSSDLIQSPEWKKMKSNWAGVILKKKNIDKLGVIAGPDMDLMGDALGAKDPTSLRDPTAGIEQGRKNAVQGLHGRLTIKGVGQKHLPQYPETWKNQKPAVTAVDEAIDEVVKADQLVDDRPGNIPIGPTGAPAGISKQAYEHFSKQTSSVRDRVQYLEDAARSGGDNGKKARQGLVELAGGKAGSPLMKEAAAQALRNLDMSDATTKEETK